MDQKPCNENETTAGLTQVEVEEKDNHIRNKD